MRERVEHLIRDGELGERNRYGNDRAASMASLG
jgi:hypothetical protein